LALDPAGAEVPDTDTVAARVAQTLIKNGLKSVAVTEFFPSKATEGRSVSVELTDRFRVALTKAPGGIELLGREPLIKTLVDRNWMAIDIYDTDVLTTLAAAAGTQAVIGGKFHRSGDFAELTVWIKSASDQKTLAEFKYRAPLPHPKGQLPDEPVRDVISGVYVPGFGGVTLPQCKSCPEPEFSPEARERQFGTTRSLLRVTILPDGHVTDIHFIKAAGYGLDQKSADAVRSWQMIPAHLPDGTPVPCRITVEVNFHSR
jgi:TonB family protein